ncbi:MAG: hypothetical protein IKB70_09970 [Bacilli bacterium]|nr:hypothetical protein [Bacilli bacterium]
MKNITKGKVLKASAVTLDVAAPLIATITQFPIWVDKSSAATVSGLFLVFAFLSAIPFMKQIKAYLKSPSAWSMWCIFLVLFVALRNIIDQMLVVCFVGLISNACGEGLYKLGEIVQAKPDLDTTNKNDGNSGEV